MKSPKAKIYEALSAVADGRVTLMGGEKAEVVSSDSPRPIMSNGPLILANHVER
jgi:hypothetical protein